MTTESMENLKGRLVQLLRDPGFQNELGQVRAKATLNELGGSLAPPRLGCPKMAV
jgi:hypothetical protein